MFFTNYFSASRVKQKYFSLLRVKSDPYGLYTNILRLKWYFYSRIMVVVKTP